MSTTVAEDKLNYKERLFVSYFLGESNGNATDAARRAGYVHPNKIGPRLAVKVGIRAAIEARLAGPALTADEVLARLSDQAAADVGDFLTFSRPEGRGKGDKAAPVRVRLDLDKARRNGKLPLVKKLKRGKYGLEIELYDAQAALVQLGKYHGLFRDDRADLRDEVVKEYAEDNRPQDIA
jgi:phage terminase small subunit